MSQTTTRALDPTPPRPAAPIDRPVNMVRVAVDVDVAHLANPLLAVSRLLVSEADAFAHVAGDEKSFEVRVAVPDDQPDRADHAEAWIRWAVHNAGVRGVIRRVDSDQVLDGR